MTRFALTALVVALLAGCGDDAPIAIKVYAATYDENPQAPPPQGMQRVEFPGSLRSRKATVLVGGEPLLTDWNIVAFHAAQERDGSRAISIRLNAYGQSKMRDFAADAANLKRPLAVQVDDRWVDVAPLLDPVGDRMTLFGLTDDDVARLQAALASR